MKIAEVQIEVSPAELQRVEQFEDSRGVVDREDVEDGEVGPDLSLRLRLVVLVAEWSYYCGQRIS